MPRSGECLFEIILRRYETRSTMMTSNRPLEDWGKLLGDVPSATAILDRFLHHAEILQITGKSYRLSQSTAANQGENADAPANAEEKPTKASKPSPRTPEIASTKRPITCPDDVQEAKFNQRGTGWF